MASTASDPDSVLTTSLDALALLEADTDHAHLLGSSLNAEYDEAGELIDTVEVYWSIYGRPGTFTTRVPFDENWAAIAFAYIGTKMALVKGIYDGLTSKNELPGGAIGPPLPAPGTATPI